MRYAMIMAGGTGTRLWPMSRLQRPKQLLPFIRRTDSQGAERMSSLLEIAAARLDGLVEPDHRFICTGEQYRQAIRESLPEFTDERILGEPMGRDTVNAVGLAAAVFQKLDKDAIFIVLTADHLIDPEETFRQRADLAFRLVEQEKSRLVTFSIRPTYAATGYGYVERAQPILGIDGGKGLAFRVERFVEKPDLSRAQAYFESGHFAWNSGMFVFHAGTFLDCLKRFKPESYEGLMKIQEAWGTPTQTKVLGEVYPQLPKISVDYAVMEPASSSSKPGDPTSLQVCTVLTDVKWLDVGSWPSFAETLAPDRAGNRMGGEIRSVVHDSKNNLIVGDEGCDGHTIALLGVEGLVVVHTKDATLIMPRDKAEQLKKLHEIVDGTLK
ncbi:MAG: mannose-1-phosphate guanylyltransferase [Pyrinomonadaceae bacterium]|nr:mannose-1-phosphate guanylyltransferase [Phycisphaerales bacterium]